MNTVKAGAAPCSGSADEEVDDAFHGGAVLDHEDVAALVEAQDGAVDARRDGFAVGRRGQAVVARPDPRVCLGPEGPGSKATRGEPRPSGVPARDERANRRVND